MDGSGSGFPTQIIATPRERAFNELEAKITELWGHLNAATYRFLMLVAEFDRREGYGYHGLANTAQWLNWQCGIRGVAAREKVRVARALEHLPQISASFERGEISYSKVRAMTRVATAANEEALLNVALHGTASHVERLVRKYRWCQRRDAAKTADEQHSRRYLHCFFDEEDGGAFVIHGRLPPEVGAILKQALDAAAEAIREPAPEPVSKNVSAGTLAAGTAWAERDENAYGARRADALRHLAESFLRHPSETIDSPSDSYQIVVHVDQAVLSDVGARAHDGEPHRCELEDGPALALDTVRRLACDCSLVTLLEDDAGEPLSVGRKTRSIPLPLARALKARDGGCRFPGCDRTRYTHGHHVMHWADGGETKLSNLVTLCTFHHKLVHEGGFGLTATHDGLFVFSRPDGRRIGECGAYAQSFRGNKSPVTDDSLETLNREHGLTIDARTSRCRWTGESMDYSQAIEYMQFCATLGVRTREPR